jgi:hypothetical protein
MVLRMYQGALFMRDLPILKRAGKAIFVTYQGDDARQGDYCRAHFPVHFIHEVSPDYYPPGSDEHKRRAIARFARYSDGMYALNPDLLHVLPAKAKFLPYANVDLAAWRPAAAPAGARLSIVHAPSHRGVKGTRHLVAAVERLQRAAVPIELTLVEGMSRDEARAAYERCDVAVDQLLAGWYGGFAVEAMALGKPVVAYLRQADLGFLPAAMRAELPLIHAEPQTIEAVLRSLAEGPRHALAEMGARARAYVEKWHDPARIAASVVADYRAALSH